MMETPVVLFIFKRTSGLKDIIRNIAKVEPKKLYLIADGPRTKNEVETCEVCRKLAESYITWDCQLIKNYAEENRGVYQNIGLGAKWVFEKEEVAIFIEDDNLPEISFFKFCEEMLLKYKDEKKILWVCGTNYQGKSDVETSYVFTQHLLPCGWASWAHKFNPYYDGNLDTLIDSKYRNRFKKSYLDNKLYKNQLISVKRTKKLLDYDKRKSSWDYQMLYSMRSNDLFGIMPTCNQIKNVGVDVFSTHGGTSTKIETTNRFCQIETYDIEFPLKHPRNMKVDEKIEGEIGQIILMPFKDRLYANITSLIVSIVGMKNFLELKNRKRNN